MHGIPDNHGGRDIPGLLSGLRRPKGRASEWNERFADAIVGGWQLAGVMLFQGGPHPTVVAPGVDPAGNNSVNVSGSGRADIVPGVPLYPANRSIADWVNPAAFVKPANNIGLIGDSPIGAVIGPGTQAVSLSLTKQLHSENSCVSRLGPQLPMH